MFYPIDSLRRGGRFYLLWVADSYPTRFSAISTRQMWLHDIRKLCDELKEMIIRESGRPTHRYSLRLSSQLMRGLVRLYQKKAENLLTDLIMIDANVTRYTNKKYQIAAESHEQDRTRSHERTRSTGAGRRKSSRTAPAIGPPPEQEPRVEDILQQSSNVVANIQDITLKEAAIPEIVLPTDGFGEEVPEQALQLAADRTVEAMLAPDAAAHRSALDLPAFDVTDKSHDRTKLATHDVEMEPIPGLDVTLQRPSVGGRLSEFEKEVPGIPDISLLPVPELPDPQQKQQEVRDVAIPEAPVEKQREQPPRDSLELEELEVQEPRPKRRRRLIIDKKTKISSEVMRARSSNPRVELRVEDISEVIAEIQVPFELFMNRPSHAGYKEQSYIAPTLTRLFLRNLGVITRDAASDRELEDGSMRRQYLPIPRLGRISEAQEVSPAPQIQDVTIQEQILPPLHVETSKDLRDKTVPETGVLKALQNLPDEISKDQPQDISDALTQKLIFLSQDITHEGDKRASDGPTPAEKRVRSGGGSVRETRQSKRSFEAATGAELQHPEGDKENVPEYGQDLDVSARQNETRRVSAMLQAAGISDLTVEPPVPTQLAAPPVETRVEGTSARRTQDSEGSETPLGSLDRTKVSLGDSDNSTNSSRFIRDEWGTEGTMLKIIKYMRRRKRSEEITTESLVAGGPVLPGYKHIIIAKCFTSLLKLKQNGFIKIIKHPDSTEIKDIALGPKLKDFFT